MKFIKLNPFVQACALSLLTGSVIMSPVVATPHALAGTTISNKIIVTYTDNSGNSYTDQSNIVNITIRAVDTATLTSNSNGTVTSAAIPDNLVYTVHTLHNTGNTTDTYNLNVSNDATGDSLDASNLLIYKDSNGNGQIDADENTPISSIELISDESVKLIVASQLPATVDVNDTLNITVDATSNNGGTVTETNHVNITFTNDNVTDPVVWENQNGGNCHAYQVVNSANTWIQAKAATEGLIYNGKVGHLVTINNEDEKNFISSIMTSNTPYHIGAKRSGTGWNWVNGEIWNYENWNSGQPDNTGGIETVAEIHSSGQWNDIAESSERNFIAEFDTDCAQPKVEVVLQAAKDTDCDDHHEGDFGTVNLMDMAPGECVVMDIKAENTSMTNANDVKLTDPLPEFTSYKLGTLMYCKGAGCTLQHLTDTIGDDSAEYDDTNGETQFMAGVMTPGQQAFARFSISID